eukprot:757391-Hanusia_phi.AAC.8
MFDDLVRKRSHLWGIKEDDLLQGHSGSHVADTAPWACPRRLQQSSAPSCPRSASSLLCASDQNKMDASDQNKMD